MADRFAAGDDAPGALLWSLLMFELWADAAPHDIGWRNEGGYGVPPPGLNP
jgi:acetylglutamate synthase